LPQFEVVDYAIAPDMPANPHLRSVVRQPRSLFERPVPVGTVSHTYSLVQHSDVAERCLQSIRAAGVETDLLDCELGLTELGEWMNFRVYFPESYRHRRPGTTDDGMDLRLECFNSVDGSSRLVVLFGWLRFVCSNGMVIGETVAELRDIHDSHLTLDRISNVVAEGLARVAADLKRLADWDRASVKIEALTPWIDGQVAELWGPKAACRVLHICRTGQDAEITDPFAGGKASEKSTKPTRAVPGATAPARTMFDVSQALSWVATRRNNAEERVEWQRQIPGLVAALV
jgi:hypothetical protein